MLKSLKSKIFSSFMLLVLMLVIAGIMSIVEFNKVVTSIQQVIDNNYKSVEQTGYMLNALEKQDNSLLQSLSGTGDAGRDSIDLADTAIKNAIETVKGNISEKDENKFIDKIIEEYTKYHASAKQITTNGEGLTPNEKNEKYLQNRQQLLLTKKAVNQLMQLNQNSIYRQINTMKENSKRAIMPAIVSIVAAIVFAFLLNFFISEYFIRPIRRLTNSIKSYYPELGRIDARINLKDEIKTLEDEINNLIGRLR